MIERIRQHPALPKDCKIVISHSAFGNEVGYAHCIDVNVDVESVFYLALELTDKHGGAPSRGHGAVSLAMLDEVMGRAASKTTGNLCYTASMTTNFCSASRIGDLLVASATVSRAGTSLIFVDGQLHADDRLVATATGTWANSKRPIPDTGTNINNEGDA